MRFEKKPPAIATAAAQLRDSGRHPFGVLDRYVPLDTAQIPLYRAVREAVPIVDAALSKLIRLVGGLTVVCDHTAAQAGLERFLTEVDTGRGQRGLQSFLDCYLDTMLTCGRAVGELVLDREGREVIALLCGDPAFLEIREGDSPLDFQLCARDESGQIKPLPYPDLLLFTPFQPQADCPYGVSLLRSMPFLTEILLKIYQAVGMNWERVGNLRFAVINKPEQGLDGTSAQERCSALAREWSAAMQAGRDGSVRDFVAVGDVDIKVIGADNQILDSQVPVRQILEQLVARTGIPPFLLGLSWSSTDMMTSEITAIRRSLEPVIRRICRLWLAVHGFGTDIRIEWEDINLQDEVEEAKAALYREQARALAMQNDGEK